MSVDGVEGKANVSESDGVITATYEPEGGLLPGAHTATFTYAESSGAERTHEWSFNVPVLHTCRGCAN